MGQQCNIKADDQDTAEIKAKVAWNSNTTYRQVTGTPQKERQRSGSSMSKTLAKLPSPPPDIWIFGPGLEVMEEKALNYMEMRGWHGRWAWEDGFGGKGKKATKTHAARAFGKNGLGRNGNTTAIDLDTAEL